MGEKMTELTQKRLKEVLIYNQETGEFWRNYKCPKLAGSKHSQGYLSIMIDGKNYLSHRLAWLYVNGEWPVGYIDHINGNKCDNKISNLRDTSAKINTENRRNPQSNNKTGWLGVYFDESRSKFVAQICINGKSAFIGRYDDPIEAHEAYLAAKRKYHPGWTI